jgi:hypothetical protein
LGSIICRTLLPLLIQRRIVYRLPLILIVPLGLSVLRLVIGKLLGERSLVALILSLSLDGWPIQDVLFNLPAVTFPERDSSSGEPREYPATDRGLDVLLGFLGVLLLQSCPVCAPITIDRR